MLCSMLISFQQMHDLRPYCVQYKHDLITHLNATIYSCFVVFYSVAKMFYFASTLTLTFLNTSLQPPPYSTLNVQASHTTLFNKMGRTIRQFYEFLIFAQLFNSTKVYLSSRYVQNIILLQAIHKTVLYALHLPFTVS